MTPANTIKQIHDLKYCTGSHPEIKKNYRLSGKPTEFGNKVWATSLVLINYLEENKSEFKDLKVLEIGCGWGILGVYLAKSMSCEVTCSDIDPCVLPIVDIHAGLNDVSVTTKRASFADLDIQFLKGFDLIIGAEVCYSEEVSKELIDLIKRGFDAGVSQVFIADPGRPDFDDCYDMCVGLFQTQKIELPGSINGKVTQLLSVKIAGD